VDLMTDLGDATKAQELTAFMSWSRPSTVGSRACLTVDIPLRLGFDTSPVLNNDAQTLTRGSLTKVSTYLVYLVYGILPFTPLSYTRRAMPPYMCPSCPAVTLPDRPVWAASFPSTDRTATSNLVCSRSGTLPQRCCRYHPSSKIDHPNFFDLQRSNCTAFLATGRIGTNIISQKPLWTGRSTYFEARNKRDSKGVSLSPSLLLCPPSGCTITALLELFNAPAQVSVGSAVGPLAAPLFRKPHFHHLPAAAHFQSSHYCYDSHSSRILQYYRLITPSLTLWLHPRLPSKLPLPPHRIASSQSNNHYSRSSAPIWQGPS
jgi:hypothetical protein